MWEGSWSEKQPFFLSILLKKTIIEWKKHCNYILQSKYSGSAVKQCHCVNCTSAAVLVAAWLNATRNKAPAKVLTLTEIGTQWKVVVFAVAGNICSENDGLASCHIPTYILIAKLFSNPWNLLCWNSFLLETISSQYWNAKACFCITKAQKYWLLKYIDILLTFFSTFIGFVHKKLTPLRTSRLKSQIMKPTFLS